MQKSIEKVCNFQMEFWTHLSTVYPDFNVLNDLGSKIYHAAQDTDNYWKQLSKINQSSQQALTYYGEYLSYIRNHPQAGREFIDRALAANFAKNSFEDQARKQDELFSEETTVVHISGNRESSGRILKVSQGLQKCFGTNKNEVVGRNVNCLMTPLFD